MKYAMEYDYKLNLTQGMERDKEYKVTRLSTLTALPSNLSLKI